MCSSVLTGSRASIDSRSVMIRERGERVVRDLDVGTRAAAAERAQFRDDDGALGFDHRMQGRRIDGHAGDEHAPAFERNSLD